MFVSLSTFFINSSLNAAPEHPTGQIWVYRFSIPCSGGAPGMIKYWRCEPGDVIIECTGLWHWHIENLCGE